MPRTPAGAVHDADPNMRTIREGTWSLRSADIRSGIGPHSRRVPSLARTTSICIPVASAAAVTSFVTPSTFGLVGLTSSPMRAAVGRSSRNSPRCFAPSSCGEVVHAGGIAVRPGKTGDNTEFDRLPGNVEHNWNRGRSLDRDSGRDGPATITATGRRTSSY